MFNKKLDKKDLEELRTREKMIKEHSLILNGLELQKQLWLKETLPKYKLNAGKDYSVDLITGKIKTHGK